MIKLGDHVRIQTGLWGGRSGVVIGVRFGGVHTVEFTAPRYLLDPAGPQEVKRLPYAADELMSVCGPNCHGWCVLNGEPCHPAVDGELCKACAPAETPDHTNGSH